MAALRLWTGPMYARYNEAIRDATLRDPGTAALDVEANSYSTTIGLIISGLIKLGRIASAPRDAEGTAVAFRGIAGLELPPAVFTPDKRGFCGVVEPGFLSLSDDEAVAAKYRCTYVDTHAHSLAFSLSLCFFLSRSKKDTHSHTAGRRTANWPSFSSWSWAKPRSAPSSHGCRSFPKIASGSCRRGPTCRLSGARRAGQTE